MCSNSSIYEAIRHVKTNQNNDTTYHYVDSKRSQKDEFIDYVFLLVKQKNPNKNVIKFDSFILLKEKSSNETLALYPIWKFVSNDIKNELEVEINYAISLIEYGVHKHIYLVLPKTELFKKHICIQSPRLDKLDINYTLKLIPYKLNQHIRR